MAHDAAGITSVRTFASLPLAAGASIAWVSAPLGLANPEITLRVYAHGVPDEPTDLRFLDFGGAKGQPDGTHRRVASQTKTPPRLSDRGHWEKLERETGFEPATLSLGS